MKLARVAIAVVMVAGGLVMSAPTAAADSYASGFYWPAYNSTAVSDTERGFADALHGTLGAAYLCSGGPYTSSAVLAAGQNYVIAFGGTDSLLWFEDGNGTHYQARYSPLYPGGGGVSAAGASGAFEVYHGYEALRVLPLYSEQDTSTGAWMSVLRFTAHDNLAFGLDLDCGTSTIRNNQFATVPGAPFATLTKNGVNVAIIYRDAASTTASLPDYANVLTDNWACSSCMSDTNAPTSTSVAVTAGHSYVAQTWISRPCVASPPCATGSYPNLTIIDQSSNTIAAYQSLCTYQSQLPTGTGNPGCLETPNNGATGGSERFNSTYYLVNFTAPAGVTSVSLNSAGTSHYLACNGSAWSFPHGVTCSNASTGLSNIAGAFTFGGAPVGFLYDVGVAPQIPTALGVVSEPHVGAGGACQLVNWTAPAAGHAPTGYSVFLHSGDPLPSLVNPMNSSAQWVYTGHVDGLSKDTCFMAWASNQWWAVVATNAAGEGIAGGPKNNTTVAGPPNFVQATATNTTLVHVNWSVSFEPNSSATGWSVFSKVSPEGSPSWPLNASGYAFEGHVDQPTHQFDVTSLTTGATYCFRVEGTNASAWGEGDISGTVACATTGNITLPPVLSGVYVPCSTFALSWSLPNGTIDGYRIDQSAPSLPFVNRSLFVPPDGNFSLRLLNVSFPQVSGELDYAAFAHSPLGYSASSNVVNFTPPAVSTIGDCGLQWGGQSQSDFAAQAGISVPAAQSMVSIFLIVMGAGIGLVAMGNGAGVVGGVGAGMLLSVALGLIPPWAVMFALVAGAALGIVGAMLGMGLRKVNRGGLGR